MRAALLSFYDTRRRDLPWRRDPNPYRVWVSEIMLQQTRVEAVIPYYERWLRRFPSLEALANAEPDEVLRAWEGLGYYSRARNLHTAARLVRECHAGDVPEDPAALRRLPGVGAYTAGAIASIAYGRPEPAVDGNVRRVLARLLDVAEPSAAWLREVAGAVVPRDRPGDFNQALMELGATVCTPRSPRCATCPVASLCRARARGTVERRPRVRRQAPVPSYLYAVVVVVTPAGETLLERRPERGLLAGLWQFPAARVEPGSAPECAARDPYGSFAGDDGSPTLQALGTVAHTFTHRREVYHVFRADLPELRAPTGGALVVVRIEHLADYALPAAQRRIAALALGAEDS